MAGNRPSRRRALLSVLGFALGFLVSGIVVNVGARALRADGSSALSGSIAVTLSPEVTVGGTSFVNGLVNVFASPTDDLDVAGIQFKVNGTNLGSEITTGACGVGWDTLSGPDGVYAVTAIARDTLGNFVTSAPVAVTVENAALQISGLAASGVTSTSATISWTTNQPSNTHVLYGTTSSYDSSTSTDQTLSTSHAQTLTGLAAGTVYHLQAQSQNAVGVSALSADFTFRTAGGGGLVTPTIQWVAPAAIMYGTALSATQLNATASVPGTFSYSPVAGTILNAGAGRSLSVVFTPADPGQYTTATAAVAIDVLKAAPQIAWSTPAPVPDGTTLGSTQLNASSSVAGTFSYSPAAGSVVHAGNVLLTASFSSLDPNYSSAAATVVLTVTSMRISGIATSNITTSTATVRWNTSLPSSTRIAYGPTSGYGFTTTLNSTLVTSHTQTLTGLTPNTVYHFQVQSQSGVGGLATSQDLTFSTARATGVRPTITWATPAPIVYGTALGPPQLSARANVPGTFTYTPASGTVLLANSGQTLSVVFRPTDSTHYTLASATVLINVTKATPILTWAAPASVVDGTVLSGTQLNATASVPGSFTYSPGLGTVVHTGTTPLSVTFTPLDIDFNAAVATVSLQVVGGTQASSAAVVGCTAPAKPIAQYPCDLTAFTNDTAMWSTLTASSGFATIASYQWGLPGDQPLYADFDGDGRPDLVVYRPSEGTWYVRFSSSNYSYDTATSYQWGLPGDIPIAADFDGDGKADLVVYRPSEATWYVRFSSSNYSYDTWTSYLWGLPGDIPIAEDFDGDGQADLAVWRPSEGTWYVLFSSSNYSLDTWTSYQWGLPSDIPVAGDFDGDGKADLVVWRPSESTWYLRFSTSQYSFDTSKAFTLR